MQDETSCTYVDVATGFALPSKTTQHALCGPVATAGKDGGAELGSVRPRAIETSPD